jgi:hypothetical protein
VHHDEVLAVVATCEYRYGSPPPLYLQVTLFKVRCLVYQLQKHVSSLLKMPIYECHSRLTGLDLNESSGIRMLTEPESQVMLMLRVEEDS